MAGTINITTDPAGTVEVVKIQLPGAPGPQGLQGIPGSSNVLTIGTVTTLAAGASASATISGISPNQVLNLKIPQGLKGDKGDPNTLTIGTVNTVNATTGASATITGTSPNQTLNLVVPRGYGVIPGGTTGQVLAKASATDYDTGWATTSVDPNGSTLVVRDPNGNSFHGRAYSALAPSDNNELTRKDYVDTRDAATLSSANSHADTGDTNTLTSANSHADTGDTNTLATAKSYTDSTDASRKTYVDTQDTATLNSANAHSDTKASIAGDLGGTAALPQVTSGANHTHTSAQISDAATAATANTVVKRDASGNINGVAITGTGLVKGNGLETTANVVVAQVATDASGTASKNKLYAKTDGGLYYSTGATTTGLRVPAHWGSGTAFPASPLAGDTFLRTDLGTNGSLWLYVGGSSGSSGWVHKGTLVCTSATRPSVVYAGLTIFETDTKLEVIYDGSAWFWTQRTVAPKLLTGTVVWSLAAGATGQTQNITFAQAFTNVPNVVFGLGGSANDYHWTVYAEGATTTGFTARINTSSGVAAPVTGNVNGYWVALGS